MDIDERTASKKRELRAVVLQALLLLALLAAVFPGVFFKGEMISPADMLGAIPPWRGYVDQDSDGLTHKLMSDVITAFHPYYCLVRGALDRGEWPLWNHLEYSGMPLLANCQSTVFYPPRLFHMFLDVPVATTLFIILKLWLCGMMAYACARGINLSRPAARFLSVGWMLASYNLIWANWSLPDVSAWAPLLFLAIELLLQDRYRRGFFAMLAGGTLIFLAGHPETALTMCMGLGAYFVLRLALDLRWGKRLWMPVGVAAAAATLSLLICMPVILPFVEYLINSHTFHARAQKMQTPMYPGAIISFLLPRFFGASVDRNFWGEINSNLVSMFYPGVAVWAGVALLVTKKRETKGASTHPLLQRLRQLDHQVVALVAATLLTILLAFDFPGLRAINRLPVMSSTLICYHASFAFFALPLLAAIGIDHWMRGNSPVRSLLLALAIFIVAGLLIFYEYRFNETLIRTLKLEAYVGRQIGVAAAAALASLCILAAGLIYPRRAIWAEALTLLLAADLIYANRGLNPTLPREEVFPETKLTQYLRSLGDHRIGMVEGNIPSGLMVPYGLEDWQAYDGLYPLRMWRFTNEMGDSAWGKFEPLRSIEYFLNDPRYPSVIPQEKSARLQKLEHLDGLDVYKNLDALPRAYLVPQLQATESVEVLINKLKDQSFEPRETVLTEQTPNTRLVPSGLPSTQLGTAQVKYRGGTRVEIETNAAADCVLVLSDAYYPGWTATVDGAPAEIFPAYYVYRGLILPAGRHSVIYTYMPRTFRAGLCISVATLAGIVIALLVYRNRKNLA